MLRNSQSAAYDFLSNISLSKPNTEKAAVQSPSQFSSHQTKGVLRESSANVTTPKT